MSDLNQTQEPHHSEDDYLLLVLRCCYECGGQASHEDVRDYIEHQLDLNKADTVKLKSDGNPRWHRIIHNLKSHGKILDYALDVPHGFELTDKGRALIDEKFQSLPQYSKPWRPIDRTVASRATVCEKWGNKTLIDLLAMGQWSKTEITKDVDSGTLNMTEFQDKYGLVQTPSCAYSGSARRAAKPS